MDSPHGCGHVSTRAWRSSEHRLTRSAHVAATVLTRVLWCTLRRACESTRQAAVTEHGAGARGLSRQGSTLFLPGWLGKQGKRMGLYGAMEPRQEWQRTGVHGKFQQRN